MGGIAEHGLDHEVIDAEAMAKRFPQFRVDEGDLVVLDRHAGFVRPELTVQTAARRAEELGARIRRYTPVREVTSVAGGGVEIRTDTDRERFDAAVLTPGPWVGDLLPDLPWEVSVYRAISAWSCPRGPPADAERPAFIRRGGIPFYGIPSPDGLTVKLGLPQAHHKPVDDPNRLDRTVAPEELETFTAAVRRHLPGLNPDPVRVSVFMEGYTDSTRPLVGPLPGCRRHRPAGRLLPPGLQDLARHGRHRRGPRPGGPHLPADRLRHHKRPCCGLSPNEERHDPHHRRAEG